MFARPFLALPILVLASTAAAQPAHSAPWSLTAREAGLKQLVDEARARNHALASSRLSAAAVAERRAQAAALADPFVSVAYTNDGWSPSLGSMPDSALEVMASQALPYPGKRRLRGEIASREAAFAAETSSRTERSVVAAVHRAWIGLALSRSLLEFIGEQAALWTQVEGVARARYAVGQGALQDALRAQTEIARLEQMRIEQEAEGRIRLAELNTLRDREVDAPVETPRKLAIRAATPAEDELVAWARSTSPEIRAAALAVDGAELLEDLVSLESKPDFVVQSAYMNRGGLDSMWRVGVGLTIPLRRERRSALRAEAKALVESGRRTARAIALDLDFRTRERAALAEATAQTARLFEGSIVPQGRLSAEASIASYQTGRSPFVAVLDALLTLSSDSAAHLRVTARYELLLAEVEEAAFAPAMVASVTAARGSVAASAGGGMTMR